MPATIRHAPPQQPVAHDIKLDIRPEADGNHLTLLCVLRNLSASEIDVDEESLPWNNADAFSVNLRDAPETLFFDNTVIRLLAFPWSNRMPMAISRDPNTAMSKPDSRPIHITFRLISEHGTPLPLTLRVQAIWIIQDSQIWNASAIEETVGESNGSSRDFLVHDGPHWRSMTPVDVVLTLRDDKAAIHWLAVRHQRIAAVE